MKFKGDEFIRNVEIEKEKAKLKQQTDALNAQMRSAIVKEDIKIDNESVAVDISSSPTSDIANLHLENKKNVKIKKYVVLSIALIILFILTIVVIKLISDDKNELFDTSNNKNNILNEPDAVDKYQALIEKKAKQTIQKKLDLNDIVKKETPLPNIETQVVQATKKANTKKTNLTDLFEMEKKKEDTKNKQKKNLTKEKTSKTKKEASKTKKETLKIKNTKVKTKLKVGAFYVQVGAFLNKPNIELLNKIKQHNLKYIVYKMSIQNKIYNKVLVGPYKTREAVDKDILNIKQLLNKPDAYVFEVK
jgi:DedD protein